MELAILTFAGIVVGLALIGAWVAGNRPRPDVLGARVIPAATPPPPSAEELLAAYDAELARQAKQLAITQAHGKLVEIKAAAVVLPWGPQPATPKP